MSQNMAATSQHIKRSSGLLLFIAYIGFISLGLPDGLVGVGWPSIRATFGLPLDALGPLLITFTVGYLLSSSNSGRVLARLDVGMLLALSCLTTAVALLGYGSTPTWWGMVALGLLSGLGAGAIDAGLNTYVATHHSPRTMNWLHAFFGVGATLGPIIMTAVLASGTVWRAGFWIVGAVQLGLATCFALTRQLWRSPSSEQEAAPDVTVATAGSTLRLPIAWLSIALFFIYTGIEVAIGQWAYSFLTESRGWPKQPPGRGSASTGVV